MREPQPSWPRPCMGRTHIGAETEGWAASRLQEDRAKNLREEPGETDHLPWNAPLCRSFSCRVVPVSVCDPVCVSVSATPSVCPWGGGR